MIATKTAVALTFICDKCKKHVPDHEGYICVDKCRALSEVPKLVQEWKDAHPSRNEDGSLRLMRATEWNSYPDRVHWHVYHRRCDPNPERDDYWFGIERASSYAALLEWSAHLMGKKWLKHTDWDGFIYRVFAMNGGAPGL
jgi:hypothetical protein